MPSTGRHPVERMKEKRQGRNEGARRGFEGEEPGGEVGREAEGAGKRAERNAAGRKGANTFAQGRFPHGAFTTFIATTPAFKRQNSP